MERRFSINIIVIKISQMSLQVLFNVIVQDVIEP